MFKHKQILYNENDLVFGFYFVLKWYLITCLSQDINLSTFLGHWHLDSSSYQCLQGYDLNRLRFEHVKMDKLAEET